MANVWKASGFVTALSVGAGLAMSVLLTFPAGAEVALFPRPESCVQVLTVQHRSCRMKTYFRCEPDSSWIRMEEVQLERPRRAIVYTDKLELIASADASGLMAIIPEPGTHTEIDFDAVLAGAEQSYSMDLTLQMFGLSRTGPYIASVRMLPDTLSVSGVDLIRIEEAAVWTLPPPVGDVRGRQAHYFNEQIGFPLFGESETEIGAQKINSNIEPAEIIFPGEPGFESEQPRYDCQDLSSLRVHSLKVPA